LSPRTAIKLIEILPNRQATTNDRFAEREAFFRDPDAEQWSHEYSAEELKAAEERIEEMFHCETLTNRGFKVTTALLAMKVSGLKRILSRARRPRNRRQSRPRGPAFHP